MIACPTGGPEVAHQIVNTGTVDMRYLALSTLVDVEICEYPDSQKVMIGTGKPGPIFQDIKARFEKLTRE